MGGRNEDLPFHTVAQKVEEEPVSLPIKLAGDIVEQQNRRESVALFEVRYFGDLHRQHKRAVLTLTGKSLYISAIYARRQVVAMGANQRVSAALLVGPGPL